MTLRVVILAAGKGTRMRSALPKVLHPVAQKPMVEHVIDCASSLNADAIHVVYGHGGEQLKQALQHHRLNWVEQSQQLGTGHAVQQVQDYIQPQDRVLVLYGDVPLIRSETLQQLLQQAQQSALALLTVTLPDATGYGRIVRNKAGAIEGIVEQKDANAEQLQIREANTGILVASGQYLKRWLAKLSNDNAQNEYYLTDIVAMAAGEGVKIASCQPQQASEVEGANNRVQLAALERAYQLRQAEQLMLAGATLLDPARIDIRGRVRCGEDVVIDANVTFEGDVELGDGVVIEANVVLKDCRIGSGSRVRAFSHIEGASLGETVNVGPYARLRPGAELADGVQVGNFVEIKKTRMGAGSKASHLTYLGDANIGAEVNIGAGTITCNYDGVNKFVTDIADGAFIGSNSSLVAPVSIGQQATVGAGSTITRDVADGELAVARAKQRNISGWQRPQKQK
ncbi:bifunctional UDP-N-acetylglucosamine diphosphorylase/glucosamine-1-phosphate N-acetyltransferase GlmU [Idiomarina xiamenensis]|uniref:Bifunctional protein GlmU n=1 Tax=Idiomarina xiamenensis 10-D-4 TaxID=740709 RepID=K2L064_9GAMM|nr:bifunctional UDP-N-acetylglucosamine diphosphorylase/glucosamine-1-phosphate N-acetyltransferase GlmU [Idiomarina xiamenensis]EKE83335.1 N-acetylglucosamine-1-phosphate uridyltransferase [Idiomarina xiamenensis 10-D-4]